MQIVNFVQMPSSKPADFIPKLVSIHQYVSGHDPDFKDFKRYLREHDLFDKDSLSDMLQFLGITATKGKSIVLGKFMTRLYECGTPEERHRLLFGHLAKMNEILVKYVIDGLAERLYSTNELYRFITSYVYPGEYITLVNFRAWMAWLQASEHIKMIGIRWGLSALGEEAMNYIKTIDVDEILEDEDGGDDADDEDKGEDEESAKAPQPVEEPEFGEDSIEPEFIAPGVTPRAVEAPVEMQSAPSPVAGAAQAAPRAHAHASFAEPRLVIELGVETVQVLVQPIAPGSDDLPLRLISEVFQEADEEEDVDPFGEPAPALASRLAQLRPDEELVAQNLAALRAFWRGRPGGRRLSAASYGFTAEKYAEDPSFELFRLSCLAVSLFRHQGRLNVARGGEAFGLLDQMGFFVNAFKSRKSIDSVLEALFKGGLGGRPEVFGNLHYFLLFRRAIKELKDEGVQAFAQQSADVVIGQLWQHLGAFNLTYEVIWIARELHAMGVWPNEDLKEVSVVPLPAVREKAFRLGFIETPYAADFPSLVGVSRRLSRLFGEEDGYEAVLALFELPQRARYDGREDAFFTRDQLGID